MPYGSGSISFGGGQMRGNHSGTARGDRQTSYRGYTSETRRPIVDPNNHPISRIYDRRPIVNTPVNPVNYQPHYNPPYRYQPVRYSPPVNQDFYNPRFSHFWDSNYYGSILNSPSIFPSYPYNGTFGNFRNGGFWDNYGNQISYSYDASNNCFWDNYGNRYETNGFPIQMVWEGGNRNFYYNDGRSGRHKISCGVINDYRGNNGGIYAGVNWGYRNGSISVAGSIPWNWGQSHYGFGNNYGNYGNFMNFNNFGNFRSHRA